MSPNFARRRGKLSERSSSLIQPEILSNQTGPALFADAFDKLLAAVAREAGAAKA